MDTNLFGRRVLLDGQYALGTFLLRTSWSVAGNDLLDIQQIEVVGGGDSGGGIISLYSFERPGTNFLIAQLQAGRLVQGTNPRL
jgi:hypothetical protein